MTVTGYIDSQNLTYHLAIKCFYPEFDSKLFIAQTVVLVKCEVCCWLVV